MPTPAPSHSLAGKVAVITGAATGIGRATAVLFARAGAKLALADVQTEELAATVKAVKEAGGAAVSILADLAKPEACTEVVDHAVKAHGRLDVEQPVAGRIEYCGVFVLRLRHRAEAIRKVNMPMDQIARREAIHKCQKGAKATVRKIRPVMDIQRRRVR